MKKFAAFLMILSLSVFAVGCGGKTKTDAVKTGDDTTKTDPADADPDAETDPADPADPADTETP